MNTWKISRSKVTLSVIKKKKTRNHLWKSYGIYKHIRHAHPHRTIPLTTNHVRFRPWQSNSGNYGHELEFICIIAVNIQGHSLLFVQHGNRYYNRIIYVCVSMLLPLPRSWMVAVTVSNQIHYFFPYYHSSVHLLHSIFIVSQPPYVAIAVLFTVTFTISPPLPLSYFWLLISLRLRPSMAISSES